MNDKLTNKVLNLKADKQTKNDKVFKLVVKFARQKVSVVVICLLGGLLNVLLPSPSPPPPTLSLSVDVLALLTGTDGDGDSSSAEERSDEAVQVT